MNDDLWWNIDGTVDYSINPSGQLVELLHDGARWRIACWTPLAGPHPVVFVVDCGHSASRMFVEIAELNFPEADRILAQYRVERARRDHPSGGGDG